MSSNSGCDDGDKFVIKNTVKDSANKTVNNKQLLVVDGKVILAFVPKGTNFTDCENLTDVTSQVGCKVTIYLYSKAFYILYF